MARSTQTQPPAEQWEDEIGAGTLLKWNGPTVLIGTLTKFEKLTEGRYASAENPSFRATFIDDDGETIVTFAPSGLASRLEQVAIGTRVRIEYDGTTSKSKAGRDIKNFSVRRSNSPSIERVASGEIPF